VTGITNSDSCCYAISANMQLVTKFGFDQKLWIFPQVSFWYWNVRWSLLYVSAADMHGALVGLAYVLVRC